MGLIEYRRVRSNVDAYLLSFRSAFSTKLFSRRYSATQMEGLTNWLDGAKTLREALPFLSEEERDWFVTGGSRWEWKVCLNIAHEALSYARSRV